MKKLKMIAFVVLMVIIALSFSSTQVLAREFEETPFGPGAFEGGGTTSSGNPILDPDYWEPNTSGDDTLSQKVGVILGVIQTIGIIVSVVVLMVLGLKYMLGSVEEKAINKKAMIPYLVGVFMVVSVTTIPNFIYQITESAFCEHKNEDKTRYYGVNIGNSEYHELGHMCNDCGAIVSTGETAGHTWGLNASQDVCCTVCGYISTGNPNCNHSNLGTSIITSDMDLYVINYKICNDCHSKVKIGVSCKYHDFGDVEDYELINKEEKGHYTYRHCNRCGEVANAGIERHEYKLNGFVDENPGLICKYCGYKTTGDLSCGHGELLNELKYEDKGTYHIGYKVCKECGGKVKIEGQTAEHTFEKSYKNVNYDRYHWVGKKCSVCELFVQETTETHKYIMNGFTDDDNYEWYCKHCKYAPTTGEIDCEHTDLKTDEIMSIGDTYYVICNGCEGKVKVDPTEILYPNN